MKTSFWNTLPRPLAGLAPMDGVTDAPFRYIVAKYSKPSFIITEFTAAEGLRAGALRLMDDFLYDPTYRPVVAQLFGSDPDAFYYGGFIAAALGFDGIDINMGCPAKNVTNRGAGAALINDPKRALVIIQKTREGISDYLLGKKIENLPVPKRIITEILKRREDYQIKNSDKTFLPVSVKTRIGYRVNEVNTWIPALLESKPDAVCIHGRTFKQLYSGSADWQAIAEASRIIHEKGSVAIGNGDLHSYNEGAEYSKKYGLDGFLIGRAMIGSPWLLHPTESGRVIEHTERLQIALEHSRFAAKMYPHPGFLRIRKHLFEYTKSFPGAKEVRMQLSSIQKLEDVERILSSPTLI